MDKNDLKKACESGRGRSSVEGIGWLNAGSLVWRAAFFVCLIAVLVLSLLPGQMLPPIDTGWDKTNHWLAYFVLGLLGLRAWPGRSPSVLVGLVAYGGAIEVLQGMSDYRSAEWLDLLADVIGLLGAVLVGMVARLVVFAGSRRRLRACGGVRVEYQIDGGRVATTPDARVRQGEGGIPESSEGGRAGVARR